MKKIIVKKEFVAAKDESGCFSAKYLAGQIYDVVDNVANAVIDEGFAEEVKAKKVEAEKVETKKVKAKKVEAEKVEAEEAKKAEDKKAKE